MDLLETINLSYEADLDGITTSVNVTSDQTEGVYLGDMAKMFLAFLQQVGFSAADVAIFTEDGKEISAVDAIIND